MIADTEIDITKNAIIYFIANAKKSDIVSNGIIFTCGKTDEEAIYAANCYLDIYLDLNFKYSTLTFVYDNYNEFKYITIEIFNLMFEMPFATLQCIVRDFKLKQLLNN